jgi:hypothetical protein
MSHDHLILCGECQMPVSDIRDCECQDGNKWVWKLCKFCREQKEYDRVEASRNQDY